MEDIRIGRKSYSRITNIVSAIGTQEICGPSDNRIFVGVTTGDGAVFFVSDKPMLAASTGLRIQSGAQILGFFPLEKFGSFVTGAIHGWATTVTMFNIIEVFLDDK